MINSGLGWSNCAGEGCSRLPAFTVKEQERYFPCTDGKIPRVGEGEIKKGFFQKSPFSLHSNLLPTNRRISVRKIILQQ